MTGPALQTTRNLSEFHHITLYAPSQQQASGNNSNPRRCVP
jgi:hypothetical protein